MQNLEILALHLDFIKFRVAKLESHTQMVPNIHKSFLTKPSIGF